MTKARENGDGGLVLVRTTSFTTASSVVVDGLSGTKNYKIICAFTNTSASGNSFRLRKNGADITSGYTGASGYAMYNGPTGADATYNGASTTWLGYGSPAFNYDILNSGIEAVVTGLAYDANYGRARYTAFTTSTVGNVTGFTFYPASGTITGNFKLYEYR